MNGFTTPVLLFASALSPQQAAAPLDARALASANARFARELYLELAGEPGNLLFSPHSIAQVLAMVRSGAAGATASEMDRVLHLPDGGAGDAFRRLGEALRPQKWAPLENEDAYQLSIATSMWGQRDYGYETAFLAGLQSNFGATFFDVDFAQPEPVRKAINAWVADATRDRIVDLLAKGQPPVSARLVLVDAIYLKATWTAQFSAAETKPMPFYCAHGAVSSPTMNQTEFFEYAESELAQIVALPYHGGLEMVVVLPKAKDGLAALAQREDLAAWTASLARRKVELSLPKFTFRTLHDLKPTLIELGLTTAFGLAGADFSRITKSERVCIESVFHQAFIAVDEYGTEAAAATAAVMGVTSAPRPVEPVRMTVDHPFLFVLRHVETGAVLFMGHVADPTAG